MIGAVIETWNFDEIVKLSGFRNVVSTNYPPTALVHDGSADERVITNGVPAYFVTVVGLSSQAEERARQLLERLYALGDWASGKSLNGTAGIKRGLRVAMISSSRD